MNEKSNQKNIGIIKSSNLCAEIAEVSDTNETAVCNLASINLSNLVKSGEFDIKKLTKITKIAIRNLNKVIDINFYPTKETKVSNDSHRPVGLGVQGLADVFFKLKIPYESEKAKELNKQIFETMYLASLEESCELAKECGSYSTFIFGE
jgi:ribonucleoside-diphosphate reductase alpha chain